MSYTIFFYYFPTSKLLKFNHSSNWYTFESLHSRNFLASVDSFLNISYNICLKQWESSFLSKFQLKKSSLPYLAKCFPKVSNELFSHHPQRPSNTNSDVSKKKNNCSSVRLFLKHSFILLRITDYLNLGWLLFSRSKYVLFSLLSWLLPKWPFFVSMETSVKF